MSGGGCNVTGSPARHQATALAVGEDRRQEPLQASDDLLTVRAIRVLYGEWIVLGSLGRLRLAPKAVNLGNASNSAQVLGRRRENGRQFCEGVVQLSKVEQRAAERGARGEVFGVDRQTGAADADGFRRAAGAAELFGERRKRQRRRILLDPASQVFNARAVRHRDSLLQQVPGYGVATVTF
jgi:hypothetical protein